MRRLLLGAAAGLLLAACAQAPVRKPADAAALAAQDAREQQLAGIDQWTLEGHLAVSDGHDGGSGSLRWIQDGERYDFELRAPITGKSFRLSGGPDGAVLEGVEGGPLRGPDAETLMRKALGWEVPLVDLRAWVWGLRAAGAPAELRFGERDLPSLLMQDGWAVDYRAWDLEHQPPLPQKVFASRPPYKVKLSIDSWSIR
ncbi:lipoprotein insertase outer membrane protein LolB [Frateuria sp. STR12]|uniref:lipoprotein insertase outer membrane protein LolB n=1 Tax=Frateuria hangzhouensis TaxID=2995589 RepID=UPI0022608D1F|nr:lipoprotein insertase outer membrane protein LolB [Frateuria sp. STR12]MCX7513884.1 lipoprotein insertase outer membrane protein LolB [Frateuria sp. STR12]